MSAIANLVFLLGWWPQGAPPPPAFGNLVPDSSIVRPGDRGLFAHTNIVIHFGPQRSAGGPGGETPQSLRSVYGLPPTGGSGVIVIVDAYNYPTALGDFNFFSSQFGLPTEPSSSATASSNKVFQVVYASGTKPSNSASWALEEALDIEWAHAMAPGAKIVLVEAASSSFSALLSAVDVATSVVQANGGKGEVSMSWGGSEFFSETAYDFHFQGTSNVVYLAASGDTGGATIWPSASPYVVAAGGTTIHRDFFGNFTGETGWSGSGGGPSVYESIPGYQSGITGIVGSSRGLPDVSFDADPNSGASVYDSTRYSGYKGWWVVGGTSLSSPALAGVVNLAGHFAVSSTAELTTIYGGLGSPSFRDILSGSAGAFSCTSGWDFVTGVGSPLGLTSK